MKISELISSVKFEDSDYEFKSFLDDEPNTEKWGKTIAAFANGDGGTLFVGVSDSGEAFGLSYEEIDKYRQMVFRENERHVFYHAIMDVSILTVNGKADKYVLAIHVRPSETYSSYQRGDYSTVLYERKSGATAQMSADEIMRFAKKKGKSIDSAMTDIDYKEEN